MPRFVRYALSLSLCFASSNLYAQSALTELYGEGVHHYFMGDTLSADQMLTRVIESGVEDPRAYYFRGLARESQGGEGQVDFEAGARLEAEGKRSFDIGRALARIQGVTRGKIEKARRDARIAAQQQALLMERSRIEAAPAPLAPAVPPTVPAEDATDPFANTAEEAVAPPTLDPAQPTTPEVDALSNPFADDPAPATTPDAPPADANDPFGNSDAPAADDPFDSGSTPPPADDPFGGDAPALDDPFQ